MNEILNRTLHRLETSEVNAVRQLANTLFTRLVQPLRQVRFDREFDFKATIRAAMRTGHLLPTYIRKEKTHPKSQLVIAMSMSGIDRCFAVGLIPLLSQLRKYLGFHLYIYTDDMVEAEFTSDGYFANDCDIAWNNVLAPNVFSRLINTNFDAQETKLLLIDSLGGLDSHWYQSINQETLQTCRNSQINFTGKHNPWTEVREWLAGQYERFAEVPKQLLPLSWESKLADNTGSASSMSKRWVDTPALREYLIRYIFNPRFGQRKHGSYRPDDSGYWNVTRMFGRLKEKFKSVHVLTPSFTDESQQTLDLMKRYRFVDFHHLADSLEGFAQTLVNIVYGRETNRLTTPIIKFGTYLEVSDSEEEIGGHSELTKTLRDCFVNCDPAPECLPTTTHLFPRRRRGTQHSEDVYIPYRDIDFDDCFGAVDSLFDDWRIDPLWAQYGKLRKAESIITFIKKNCIRYSNWGLEVVPRSDETWSCEPRYDKTKSLEPFVNNGLAMYAQSYYDWFAGLPLRHVVWCTVGKFRHDLLAISACPADEPDQQCTTIWHEFAHWAEHVCPAIGVFTNSLLQFMTGEFSIKRIVPVGIGEFAMPVRPGKTPWIADYAGKWYRRHHPDLPNPAEIFSVHAPYFRSPEALVELLEHDPWMAKATAFIFMGGPLALLDKCILVKAEKVAEEISQYGRKSEKYSSRGSGKRSKTEEPTDKPASKLVEERRRFGI